ncbi:AtpZ/AtpI family protein [Mycoplasmatota bacterium]|nr:AtpZ/AtpI family protein [Mycoplasmatota bacterium]
MSAKNTKSGLYIFNMVIQFFFETFIAMVIGYFLGQWLDKLFFNEQVILTYVFIIIGIFAGLRNFIVRALKYGKEEENEK